MRVNVEISEAEYGKFSNVYLGYVDVVGEQRSIKLNIDFSKVYFFNRDLSSVQFDLFLVSAMVYGIDNLVQRELYSIDGWRREIEVEFPVNHLERWESNVEIFSDLLTFLTGDSWRLTFRQSNVDCFYTDRRRRKRPSYNRSLVKSTSLFSGGLDSLVGIIDQLEKLSNGDRIVLASHFDSNSSGPNSDQTRLFNYLNSKYPTQIYWIQSVVSLSTIDSNGVKVGRESSYRSRSLLFIGIALLLTTTETLIIPENGTISLNYPLTPSRVSTLSTRTTHPYVLSKAQELLNGLGIGVELENPYSLKTKGEVLSECGNLEVLNRIYKQSVSCGKRGRRQHWEIRSGTDQCGVCMPCIYRQAAIHAADMESQLYGNNILNASSVNQFVDMPALFSFLKKPLDTEKVKRDLLVNGTALTNLDSQADLVIKSQAEVKHWLIECGNEFVRQELGQYD